MVGPGRVESCRGARRNAMLGKPRALVGNGNKNLPELWCVTPEEVGEKYAS